MRAVLKFVRVGICAVLLFTSSGAEAQRRKGDVLLGPVEMFRGLARQEPALQRRQKPRSGETAGNWTTLSPANGFGGTVCNTSGDKYACFALRCSSDNRPEFAFLYNVGTYPARVEATVAVDDRLTFTIALSQVSAGVMAGPAAAQHHTLLEALKAGKSFAFDPGFRHEFSLSGSSVQIERTLRQCGKAETSPLTVADATIGSLEATANNPLAGRQLLWDTDLPGNDYRGGLTDPALRGVTRDQCATFCEVDNRCRAYTHNSSNNVCMLKEAAGSPSSFPGATSGIFHSKQVRAKARTTVPVTFTDGLYWREEDTRESYVERIRAGAQSSGGACDAERAALGRLESEMSVAMPRETATAGKAVALGWSGNSVDPSIVAYLVISVNTPVRFTGKGFLALAPDAVAPFGIGTAADKSRAIVALHSRGAGRDGTVSVLPVRAGSVDLEATLVGYLRTCKQEVVLKKWASRFTVDPARPEIVLEDPVADNIYDRRITVSDFAREIRFNDDRLAIIDTATGGEVLEREGREVALSPTRRFIGIRANKTIDVIDVIDGAKVATLGGYDLGWFNNDSFVISTSSPWGRTWLASTLSNGILIEGQQTACAVCSGPEYSFVTLDLENMVGIVAGQLGYAAFDLQDRDFSASDPNLIIADEGLKAVRELIREGAEEIGATGPIGFQLGWNAPLGLKFTHGAPMSSNEDKVYAGVMLKQTIEPYKRVALAGNVTGTTRQETVLRGLAPLRIDLNDDGRVSRRSLLEALEPFGFQPATETAADVSLDPPEDVATYEQGEVARAAFKKRAVPIVSQMSGDFKAMKAAFEWARPVDFQDEVYCQYVEDGLDAGKLPQDPDILRRFRMGDRTIWVVRGLCQGGPTAGTQLSKSYLAIFDQGTGTLGVKEAIVQRGETMRANEIGDFHERRLDVKATATSLLFYVKGAGTIGLFDLKTRKFLFQKLDLPRGDMLKDVFLDKGGRFILQENMDGTFFIHAVATGTVALTGRFVDDEVVFWNDSFQFDATPEGSAFVNLRFPGAGGQYSFQQFDSRLRVDRLMQAVLTGTRIDAAPTIGAPPSLDGTLEGDSTRITGKVVAHGRSAVVAVHVYQDGVRTDRIAVADMSAPIEINVERSPAARWVALVAEDANGLLSLPIGRDFGAGAKKPVTRVLSVGIDVYDDDRIAQLSFARSDAERIIASFKALAGKTLDTTPGNLVLLSDHAASKAAILAAAETLAEGVGRGETAVFFFAGHGLRGKDGKFYIATSATRADDVEATSLAWDDLAPVLSKSEGRLIVLLDACHSGAAGTGIFATNDDAVTGLRRSTPAGLVVLSASKGRELSRETAKSNGGVFTDVLTHALADGRQASDSNGNGVLEVSELFRAVKVGVRRETGGLQTPWLARNQMIGEFSLF